MFSYNSPLLRTLRVRICGILTFFEVGCRWCNVVKEGERSRSVAAAFEIFMPIRIFKQKLAILGPTGLS